MTIISHDVHQVEVTLDTDTVDTIAVLEAQLAHTPSRASLSWAEVEPGLWSANYGGYFGGTVDKRDGHYFVSDTFGQYVGDFRSLEYAQSRLAERLHIVLPSVIRPVD
jgi:hypothetical protein